MLENLSSHISLVFILATLATLALFYVILQKSSVDASLRNWLIGASVFWLGIQGAIALSGFYYTNTTALPPRFPLAFVPLLIVIISLFFTKKGKAFMDSLSMKHMTWLHIVRIPVELVLYWLALEKAVPELMTFAGRNFDILAGITAPFVAYFGIQQGKMGKNSLLAWNFICFGLLMFIVGNAFLSAPLAFQQFAFDQPNIGVLYFPFIWLPAYVVPVVMFCHLASIRQLLGKNG